MSESDAVREKAEAWAASKERTPEGNPSHASLSCLDCRVNAYLAGHAAARIEALEASGEWLSRASHENVLRGIGEWHKRDSEQRIAAAVLEEREAIAAMFDNDEATYGYECDNKMIAAAIRARGETK